MKRVAKPLVAVPGGRGLLAAAVRVRAFRDIRRSGLFDLEWYSIQARREFTDVAEAIGHYVRGGRLADLSPHPLYEPERHIQDRERRRTAHVVPFGSYLRSAHARNVIPHPLFWPRTWLAKHPEAVGHRYGAWGHFLEHATDDTPLPLPPALLVRGHEITWGQWRGLASLHVARWAQQVGVANPYRLSLNHDAAAEQRLRQELKGYPLEAVRTHGGGPLVSVITAVRNRPHQVLDAIASIVGQTLQSWELLVVDDGSDDATPDVVEKLAEQEPRVRLMRRSRHGVSAARNAGAAEATGRYVAWLDSDNAWQPEYLEIMVRTMAGRGIRAAHAACQMVSRDRVRYREFDGGLEHLAEGNFVDLNVLVVERDLLTEVGRFDESLPRAVDYDLVCRIARRTSLPFVPYVGVLYQDDADDADRISNRELHTWNYVVRDRHVVAWDRLKRELPYRIQGRVSVVVNCRGQWPQVWDSLRSIERTVPEGTDLEIVVVDGAGYRSAYLHVAAVEAVDPRIRVIRTITNYNRGGGYNVGIAHSTGATIILTSPGVIVSDGWLEPLRKALDDPTVAVAAPVVETHDGLLMSVGLVFPEGTGLPIPLLSKHPLRDARTLGDVVEVPAVSGHMMAVRAADLVAVHGFDPLYVDAWDDADLALRLADLRGGRSVVRTASRAACPPPVVERPDELSVQNRRLFASRWLTQPRGGEELWGRAGFEVTGWIPVEDGFPEDVQTRQPDLVLRPMDGVRLRRWAVEIPYVPTRQVGLDAEAEELAEALERLGQAAVVRLSVARGSCPSYLDDIIVALQGQHPLAAEPGRPTIALTGEAGPEPQADEGFAAVLAADGGTLGDALRADPDAVAKLLLTQIGAPDSAGLSPAGAEASGGR